MDASQYLSFDHPFDLDDDDHSSALTQTFLWVEIADRTIELQCGFMEGHSGYRYRVQIFIRDRIIRYIKFIEKHSSYWRIFLGRLEVSAGGRC